ncbi:hypothetical protein [Streptomyces sp900116325]|uniref:hypothetical protein n=1 Tax=Streptomyces sp. 900116325 TaxID=3154295 RepID=UPI0033B25C89
MNTHVTAAIRAQLLAEIVRGRAQGYPEGSVLRTIVRNQTRASKVLHEAAETDRPRRGRPGTVPDGGCPHGERHFGRGHRLCLVARNGYAPELRDLIPR